MRYSVVLLWDQEDEVWVAEVPAMGGAATSGETVEEALAMAQEIIEGRIAVHRDYGEPVPLETVPAQVHQIEITVPESTSTASPPHDPPPANLKQ